MPAASNEKIIRFHDLTPRSGLRLLPADFPVELDMAIPGRSGILLTVFGLFMCLMAFLITSSVASEGKLFTPLAMIVLPLYWAFSIAIVLGAVHIFVFTHKVLLNKNGAQIYRKGLFGQGINRRIMYSEFQGVLIGTKVQLRNKRQQILWQTVELIHDDKRLNIPLVKIVSDTPPRDVWKQIAAQLHVPALQKDGDQIVGLSPMALDQSLQERAGQGEAAIIHLDQALQQPPKGLQITQKGGGSSETLHIRITADRLSLGPKLALPILPLVFIATPFFTGNVHVFFPAAGWFFLLVIEGYMLFDHLNKRELKITHSNIFLYDKLKQGKHGDRLSKIPLEQIQHILLKKRGFKAGELEIQGLDGKIPIGPGLSKKANLWLQNFLRAAVVSA